MGKWGTYYRPGERSVFGYGSKTNLVKPIHGIHPLRPGGVIVQVCGGVGRFLYSPSSTIARR